LRDESPLREVWLALPGATDDLYVRHQQVWAALATQAREGRDFVYRYVSPRVALVRGACLRQGVIVGDLPPPSIKLDFVASDRVDRNKERPVPHDQVGDWAARLLVQHGMMPTALVVLNHSVAIGTKIARAGQPGHRIRYSVATVRADVVVVDPGLSRMAWRLGVGRGRRFGFGMLVAA